MGIRGAWSLLSNDPRRFGSSVVLQHENDDRTCIFVDGPSLLYHIATTDIYDQSPPLHQARIIQRQKPSVQQADPYTIYTRVTSFVGALLQVCHGDVHVVMDGLAPASKQGAQKDRLRSMAIQGEQCARKQKSSCKLLHLLAESSMIEAIDDIRKQEPRLSLHQPSHGEAETFIDAWIRQEHYSETDRVFILSDDTDFLVYSSCPGFIPLKTLEFHVLDGKLSLTGFSYQRSKFVGAFFSTNNDARLMTTVAALAGCDYGMPDFVGRIRTKMIQSDIGGLRRRMRNDPTSAAALTAILRFVSHWQRRYNSGDLWLQAMMESICSSSEECKQVMVFLKEIHQIYFPEQENDAHTVDVVMSVDCRRLIECGVLYCRPLVETWEKRDEPRQRNSPSRKQPQKPGKKRRKRIKRSAAVLDDLEREEEVVDNPPRDTASIPFPLSQSYIDQCLSSGSAWTVFRPLRCRLYGVLSQFAKSHQQDGRLKFHPMWTSLDPTVTEYIRVGSGNQVDYVSQGVSAQALDVSLGDAAAAAILGSVVSNDQVDRLVQKQDWLIAMALLMLPVRSAILLLLLSKAPAHFNGAGSNYTRDSHSLQQSLLLISVALFHAKLLLQVQELLARESSEHQESSDRVAFSRILRNDVAEWIWNQMEFMDELDQHDGTGLLDSFFDQFNVSRAEGFQLNESELQQWRDESKDLWRIHCGHST